MATSQQPHEYEHSDDDFFYKMTADPRGLCVIINNRDFEDMDPRRGSDKDKDNLHKTFSQLKFHVMMYENLTSTEMVTVIKKVSMKDHSRYDCLVVCILSHGTEGHVIGTDGREVRVLDITSYVKPLSCETLAGKPKLFFIQACQGKGKQTMHASIEPDVIPAAEEEMIPNDSDMLLSYSTVTGYQSFRDTTSGSIFISCLTRCLNKYARRESILDILTRVNNDVCKARVPSGDGDEEKFVGQCPFPQFTLRKKVILGSDIEHTGLPDEAFFGNLSGAESDAYSVPHAQDLEPRSNDSVMRRPTSAISDPRRRVQYVVTVITDEEKHVPGVFFIKLFGIRGVTENLELKNGSTQDAALTFEVPILDVAPLKMLWVTFIPGKGKNKTHLNKIELKNMATRTVTVFHHNEPLGSDPVCLAAVERDRRLLQDTEYKITVETSSCRGAGTDANVYVILFGSNGKSRVLHLEKSETNKDPFEKGHTDVFMLKVWSLGELYKLHVWHDNKKSGAAWHLAKIEVKDMSTGRAYTFKCDRWLSDNDDDKQILRDLVCSSADGPNTIEYEIEVKTADEAGSGTFQCGWIILKGSEFISNAILLYNNAQHKILQRGETDNFTHSHASYGSLESCLIGCFESKLQPPQEDKSAGRWLCHQVVVTDTRSGIRSVFPCHDWLSPTKHAMPNGVECFKAYEEESYWARAKKLGVVIYEVNVTTGDCDKAGTDSNVSITIFSDNGDTGQRRLTKQRKNLFERGSTDVFQVEAVDLGDLTSVLVEHDQKGFGPDWFLKRVEVTNKKTNTKTVFPCDKWLTGKVGETSVVLRPEASCRPRE